MTKTITRWEKFKRAVAHSFHLETKGEIAEHFENLRKEEIKQQAAAFLAERKAQLEIEYEHELFKIRQDEFKRKLAEQQEIEDAKRQAELEAERQEAIRLFKTNNWDKAFTNNTEE
jgi:hypothetical protein